MRQFVFLLIAFAVVVLVYFFKSARPHEKLVEDTIVRSSAMPEQQTIGAATPDDKENEMAMRPDAKLPSMAVPSRSEPNPKSVRREPGPNDSILTINELRQRYAVADLRQTLKAAKPFDPTSLELPTRPVWALRFRSATNEIFHFRQKLDHSGGCVALKSKGRLPIIGHLEAQEVKEWELPDRYAAIVSLKDIYYFLILTEVSEERQGNNEPQNHLHYLYRRHKDGSIRYLASVDGDAPHRGDVFKMSPEEFCRDSFLEEE